MDRKVGEPSGDGAEPARMGWTPESMMTVRSVSHVRPSPDGRRVAYTVTQAVLAPDRSEYITQVYLANADGSDSVRLTSGHRSSTDPQWSPMGECLACVSDRSGTNDLYLLRLGGDAEQLTDGRTGVSSFAWSPDGRQIAFTRVDPPTPEEETARQEREDVRWVGEGLRVNRLHVLSLDTNLSGRREPRVLTTEAHHVGSFDWSPDGAWIAFCHSQSPSPDGWASFAVSLVDVASGQIRPLVTTRAMDARPFYSPDGQWIAVASSDLPPRWAQSTTLYLVPSSGGVPRALPPTPDRRPTLVGWTADGTKLYFTEQYRTETCLCSTSRPVRSRRFTRDARSSLMSA